MLLTMEMMARGRYLVHEKLIRFVAVPWMDLNTSAPTCGR